MRCALDHLTTLPFVDNDCLGILGLCAGGGYAVKAAMTEQRFKAVATVVGVNLGRAFRQAEQTADSVARTLDAVGKQRTAEARGQEMRRDPWIPDTPEEARKAGITDRDVLDAIDFYRTPRGYHKRSTNRMLYRSLVPLLGFDAFHMASELLLQPVQVIVGGRLGTTFSFDDSKRLFELASNRQDFFVVDGAGHYDLYDKPEYVDQAVERLDRFYSQHLRGSGSSVAQQS